MLGLQKMIRNDLDLKKKKLSCTLFSTFQIILQIISHLYQGNIVEYNTDVVRKY